MIALLARSACKPFTRKMTTKWLKFLRWFSKMVFGHPPSNGMWVCSSMKLCWCDRWEDIFYTYIQTSFFQKNKNVCVAAQPLVAQRTQIVTAFGGKRCACQSSCQPTNTGQEFNPTNIPQKTNTETKPNRNPQIKYGVLRNTK